VGYLYQSGNYSYLIKVGLGLGEDTCIVLALFNFCLLGCQSLNETLLRKYYGKNKIATPNHFFPGKYSNNLEQKTSISRE
jgi:hypothetical protein